MLDWRLNYSDAFFSILDEKSNLRSDAPVKKTLESGIEAVKNESLTDAQTNCMNSHCLLLIL